MKGTINSVHDHGSIVIVRLDLEDGESRPAYMDHRAFGWLVEGEGMESQDDLIGRPVSFDGDTIEFLDNVEVS